MPDSSINSDSGFKHLSVLADAMSQPVAALPAQLLDGGLMIDATLGGGGPVTGAVLMHNAAVKAGILMQSAAVCSLARN